MANAVRSLRAGPTLRAGPAALLTLLLLLFADLRPQPRKSLACGSCTTVISMPTDFQFKLLLRASGAVVQLVSRGGWGSKHILPNAFVDVAWRHMLGI